jgi:AcrR family transcriptional regulator/DNA-binding MarR family transcriptional regulator
VSASSDKPTVVARLDRGRNQRPRDEVDDFQRARIVSAMVEVAAELGYVGAAVARVVARAGISRRTFYELFDGREDCFLAAFEWGVGQMGETMIEAYGSQRSWRDRARQALAALLVFLDSEPELARACVIEALGAGKLVLRRRAQVLEELAAALGVGAPQSRGPGPPLLTAEGVIGGAFSVIHGRLLEQGFSKAADDPKRREATARASGDSAKGTAPGPLIELHGQLMGLIALPYLGPRTAGEELTRTAPDAMSVPTARAAGDGGRLLERLDMRLTYRTVRCLTFIGEHPGASNREVARGAEVSDDGQASKLLGRLVGLDLIANSRPHGPGYPNRWTLTPHGEQVLGAVRRR